MIRPAFLLGALAMSVGFLATTASAATVRMYTPGGAPCAGACTLEWAAAEFDVPVGEPQRMTILAGTTIVKMSYGRDGKPYWMNDSAVFAEDQPGEGYQIDGTPFWMVKIDECQNWALVVMADVPIFSQLAPPSQTLVTYNPPSLPPVLPPWTPTIWPETPCCDVIIPPCCTKPPEEPHLNPVPLPASMFMMLAGLGAFGLVKVRRG